MNWSPLDALNGSIGGTAIPTREQLAAYGPGSAASYPVAQTQHATTPDARHDRRKALRGTL